MEDPNAQYEEEDSRRMAPEKPWAVEVDVYLQDDSDPPVFQVVSTLPIDNSNPQDELLIFENKGRPGFEIRFHLYDQTGKGYRFPTTEDDAVWSIIADSGCPMSEAHEVFEPIRVTEPNGTMLVVRNDNSQQAGGAIGKFRYTLNVSTNGRAPYLPLDPGGVDQNGPRTLKFR